MSYQVDATKIKRIAFIKEQLKKDDRWLLRGLIVIYNRQTIDEKASEQAHHHNNVGFSGYDSPILTSYAQQYLDKGFLTPKQLGVLRNKMVKYARQLDSIAQEKLLPNRK